MREWITIILLLIGATFIFLSAVGLLRLPDLFTRMQAASKAATLGIGCILLATVVHFGQLDAAARALLITAFVMLTTPLAAHMIGRSAYVTGEPLEEDSTQDELRDHYERMIGMSETQTGLDFPEQPDVEKPSVDSDHQAARSREIGR